jgi:hypothetical protein
VHNFFAATGAAVPHLVECRLTMTRMPCFVSRARASDVARCAKSTVSSAFFAFKQTFAEISATRERLHAAPRVGPPSLTDIADAASLTHKIKWSPCYFSPAVVIRLQCGSIRDCTAPRSPSTLRLGGQQWRRREKRRKRQRRPRSVGRRSSQSRNRSSASHVSKIASHGPAGVEADRLSAATGRLRWATGGAGGMRVRAS